MVRTLNVTLDDDDFARVENVKEEIGLTWQELIIQAGNALAEREDLD